jgi:hypothetical protein
MQDLYAKSRETCQKIGRSKAAPLGYCIKSCILDKSRDCEKPSTHADALGMATSDNAVLCKPHMNNVYKKMRKIFHAFFTQLKDEATHYKWFFFHVGIFICTC